MPNDAKLGLVLGVSTVVVVAITCFRSDLVAVRPGNDSSPAAVAGIAASGSAELSRGSRGVSAKTTGRPVPEQAAREYKVQEGDTLANLAERYYGDGKKSDVIYQMNREILKSPDGLIPGTVLLIPDCPPRDVSNRAEPPEQEVTPSP